MQNNCISIYNEFSNIGPTRRTWTWRIKVKNIYETIHKSGGWKQSSQNRCNIAEQKTFAGCMPESFCHQWCTQCSNPSLKRERGPQTPVDLKVTGMYGLTLCKKGCYTLRPVAHTCRLSLIDGKGQRCWNF